MRGKKGNRRSRGQAQESERDCYVKLSGCADKAGHTHARTHTETIEGGGKGSEDSRGGHDEKGEGAAGSLTCAGRWAGKLSQQRARTQKTARDAAPVTNKWLTKLKNQTKSERGKNKNAKATDKVTETDFLFFWFHIQAGCDV